MKNDENQWTWDIDLQPLIGEMVRIETHESMYRTGRVSGIRMRDIPFLGETVQVLEGLELNGDSTDVIPFELIKRVDMV